MGWMKPTNEVIETPCIGVCTLDDRGFCMGCRRTVDEISDWLDMSPDDRLAVLEELDSRSGIG